jgi:cytochrome bd ubiquinol oxidase subunit II
MHDSFWQNAAFLITVFFFFVYSVLDGFDLGIGMLLPFVKSTEDRQKLMSHFAPFFGVNEIWLVMGVGFIFAAFPLAFSILLSSFYLPLMLAIAGFILRTVAIEFSHQNKKHARMWYMLVAVASFGIAVSALYSVSLLMEGLPIRNNGIASENPMDYLSAGSLLFAIAGSAVLVWHGGGYVRMQEKKKWAKPSFLLSSTFILAVWIWIGLQLYPNILRSRIDSNWHLGISQITTTHSSLKPVVVIALGLIPIILGYIAYVYRVFKKK